MRIKKFSGIAGALAGALIVSAASTPAGAHHSFAAEFDINRPIRLTGVVTRMEFSNPHSWLHIEVTTDDGDVQQWAVEGGAPNALIRRGWNRNSIPAGVVVEVEGFQARDRAFRANGREVRLPDGSSLFMGSEGAGAPSAD
jgi:DNA/RNA endonuclease YhcR with UshA esterase domain